MLSRSISCVGPSQKTRLKFICTGRLANPGSSKMSQTKSFLSSSQVLYGRSCSYTTFPDISDVKHQVLRWKDARLIAETRNLENADDSWHGASSETMTITEAAGGIADPLASSEVVASIISYSPAVELGNRPSEIALKCLEFVHESTGLPWWATIIVATFSVRTLLMPLTVKGYINARRLALVKPELDRLQAKVKTDPTISADPAQARLWRQEMAAVFAKGKCSPWLGLAAPIAQMPIFLSFFFGLKSAGEVFPAMAEDGALWFSNLTAADPTYALPALSGLSMLLILEMGADGMGRDQALAKNLMRFASIASIPLTAGLPASIFLYWISSNGFSVVQTLLMKTKGVMKYLDIPDVQQTPFLQKPLGINPFRDAKPASESSPIPVRTYTHRSKK